MRGDLKMEAAGDGGLKPKMKDAGGLEGGDTLKRKAWEVEGEILKLKKEMLTAMDLWYRAGRMARKDAQEKAQLLAQEKSQQQTLFGARKKKMKMVKTKFSKEFIEHIAVCPFTACNDLSDEEIAQRALSMREVYAAQKIYKAKRREYWNTLVAQQQEIGYAEDEIEVTDDEEEAVVKN